MAWRSGLKFLGRLRSLILWSSLAYVCLYGSANALLSPLGRVMNSTAHVSESAANTLASILDGGTQLVTVSTNVVKAASVSTLSVAHAAWDGVDLVGLNATRVAGRVLGHRAADIEEWLLSAPGREVLHDPAEEALRLWQNLLVSQTFALPVVSADTQALQAAGEYWTASGTVAFSAAGMVVFEFQALRLTFAPRWANPVWHLAGWDVTSEFAQIQHIACEFAASVPAVNATWDQVIPAGASAALGRAIGYGFRRAKSFLLAPWRHFFQLLETFGDVGPCKAMGLFFGALLLWCVARRVMLRWACSQGTASGSWDQTCMVLARCQQNLAQLRTSDWARFVERLLPPAGWTLVPWRSPASRNPGGDMGI